MLINTVTCDSPDSKVFSASARCCCNRHGGKHRHFTKYSWILSRIVTPRTQRALRGRSL